MSELHFLRTRTTDEAYAFAEQLLLSAFPDNEHRDLAEQRCNTDHNPLFHHTVVFDGTQPVGLLAYWLFADFCYVEHLATSPHLRGGGYGKRILDWLHQQHDRPVVLEVELPTDELSRRRIGFYQRQGYRLLPDAYVQPPYRKGDAPLPMKLMVHEGGHPVADIAPLRATLYREVYGWEQPSS